MNTKALVKILRRWHIIDGELCCPQCWGRSLAQFDAEGIVGAKDESINGNSAWARKWPACEVCGRDARE